MTVLQKLWAALLTFSSIMWFVDAGRVIAGYHPEKLTMIVAFVITGVVVFKWAVGAWNEK